MDGVVFGEDTLPRLAKLVRKCMGWCDRRVLVKESAQDGSEKARRLSNYLADNNQGGTGRAVINWLWCLINGS